MGKKLEKPSRAKVRSGSQFENGETVIAYLQYALREVRDVSAAAADLLELTIETLCEEVDAMKASVSPDEEKRLS
jgi:hypothetical protein